MFDLDENEKPQTYQQILEKLFLNKDDANRFRVSEYFNHTINIIVQPEDVSTVQFFV